MSALPMDLLDHNLEPPDEPTQVYNVGITLHISADGFDATSAEEAIGMAKDTLRFLKMRHFKPKEIIISSERVTLVDWEIDPDYVEVQS